MKKTKKIILILNIIFCIFLTVGIPKLSYANELDPFSYEPKGDVDQNFINWYGGSLSNVLFTISVIVAVISLMIIGLKYIIGSVQEKADYKKNLIPVVVGIFIISFITAILSWIAQLAQRI